MMKHTPIQWFAQQLGISTGTLLETALDIEKTEILKAWNAGFNSQPFKLDNEDSLYYEETYINEAV